MGDCSCSHLAKRQRWQVRSCRPSLFSYRTSACIVGRFCFYDFEKEMDNMSEVVEKSGKYIISSLKNFFGGEKE